MRMLLVSFLVVSSLLLSLQAQNPSNQNTDRATDDMNCGMVYGKGHVFTICAPKGWVLDNTVLNDQGIYAAFYPEGSSWKSAATVMYVNTVAKGGENTTVAGLMQGDARRTREGAPKVNIKVGEPLQIQNQTVPVQVFEQSSQGSYEAVAYVDSPEIIVMLVISSPDQKEFERNYPAFVELAKSYQFLTKNVHAEGHNK